MTMRKNGWTVAVVDFRPFGGTCALRGCDPKKMLVTAAEIVDLAWRMRGNGIAGDTHIEWPGLMALKRRYTDPIPKSTEDWFVENGIEPWHGKAQFRGHDTMEVDGMQVEGGRFLLAAGAEPIGLGIPGEEHVVTRLCPEAWCKKFGVTSSFPLVASFKPWRGCGRPKIVPYNPRLISTSVQHRASAVAVARSLHAAN